MKETPVMNDTNLTSIEYINIYGLFKRYNVKLPFSHIANIYIGENGMGKTTILNCIYFLLDKKFSRLTEINFEAIEIKFQNEIKPHLVTINDFEKYNNKNMQKRRTYLDEEIIEHFLGDFILDYSEKSFFSGYDLEREVEKVSRRISMTLDIPVNVARRSVYEYLDVKNLFSKIDKSKEGDIEKVKSLIKSINENINQKILYLTTYRRIEDDYSKLNISAEKARESDALIRFGMSDVLNTKNKILENIRREAIEGLNKMAGVLLKQYSNLNINQDRYKKSIDIKTVQLVLNRIGDEIDDRAKTKIIDLISRDDIKTENYKLLRDLLDKLIISYESQKEYDDKIKRFAGTCNKYLNGKQFYYNPSELTLEIYITANGEMTQEIVELPQLSSGEKQIVSLFSKLYLENEKENIVIIDEPELSLSMRWQSMLLPDIIRSNNCKLLLTVTHSPFIFDNEFDLDARDMRKFIENTVGE